MKNKITLKELSKLLNVSVSTVSKALNDSPEISQKTIERVKELAALHNYRPNPVAVNLKSSRSGTIGVIVPNIANTFFAKVLSGIEAQAQEVGLQVMTYISDESYEREVQIVEHLTAGFVDGVLLSIAEESQRKRSFDHIYSLIDYDIPVVLYDRINYDMPVDKIGVNDAESFKKVTTKLIKKGVKRIGLVSTILHLVTGKERIRGYKEALLPSMEEHIAASTRRDYLDDCIYQVLIKEEVEAVLCTDFESTLRVYRYAYEHNIRIPQDLKIIGFLNDDIAPYMTPSLSYIEQNPQKIGKGAMKLLHKRLTGEAELNKYREKIVKTKLIDLESTNFEL
ncbi:LacI family DNA-binding transcriptional regulator [Zunongwangia sp.]|uniref:LacI family DNA-binding transcriptional regulator n=1 Tax=Zunongwangia sp. TaxID=1965325 RepID=UPI003AA81182